MSQLRQNIITGEWVVISTERAKRPVQYVMAVRKKIVRSKECVFCDKKEKRLDENKSFYVIPNKFPAFEGRGIAKIEGSGVFRQMLGLGRHEVVVARSHIEEIANAEHPIWTDLFAIIRKRMGVFEKTESVKFVMPIYNNGAESGASIQHPHAQIFGSPIVPNYIKSEFFGSKGYFLKHKKCVFCEIIKMEQANGLRIVHQNDSFVAFCFYASRMPFETWILPLKHNSDFSKLSKKELSDLGEISENVFGKIYKSLGNPAWNFFVHSKPNKNREVSNSAYHWHLEIVPRLTKFGGFELGANMVINVVAPEAAAEFLRKY